ncbi:MAG TPA: CHRD domain-containing protein [Thermoleophilaceae bacterium]|nr:CHRD domain-containing protein [Thermoleophilaceae bacterium]
MKLRLALTAFASAAVAALVIAVGVSGQANSIGINGFFASLEGADPNGAGAFSATFKGKKLCFGVSVKNIKKPIAAHIHKGGKKADGPVVVTLEWPSKGGHAATSACVEVAKGDRQAILDKPGGYYVNVHTADFPNGAIRGQLFAK